uniref:SUEL-type lectin domain-containing protein n=1 Tax=Mola mola TaxID=94237 RepID=A0A3Q4BNS1_MOLML
ERAITCASSRDVQRLSYAGVISVQAALYGRADKETCSEGRHPSQLGNTECSLDGTVDLVCELNVNFVHTSNPCTHMYKYLDTNYTCVPAIHLVTCEDSSALIADCDSVFTGSECFVPIFQTTCSYKRPASHRCLRLLMLQCFRSCNGKNSCTIRVGNTMFGDPCRGTYK